MLLVSDCDIHNLIAVYKINRTRKASFLQGWLMDLVK